MATSHAQLPSLLHSIRLHNARPANARKHVAGETVPEQTVMAFPTRFDCRQQLQYGQQCRSFLLLCGAGAQDVRAITLFKPPWLIYPSLSVLSSSHGGRSSGSFQSYAARRCAAR